MKRRKICVVTTSRADFGLLSGLIQEIQSDKALRLQLIVSGMHLGSKFGNTWRDIQSSGIKIDRRIPLQLTGRSNLDNLNSISLGLKRFGGAFSELKPDFLVLLGDRFELLAPAIAALMLGVPIAHIHGGELSEGAIDDSVRHAITKMASLHFPATEEYRRRVIQLGEAPDRVFNFGAPGLDQLHHGALLTRRQLEQELGIDRLEDPTALVTFHPVTRGSSDPEKQVGALLSALKSAGSRAVITMANADAQGARINQLLQDFCAKNPVRYRWFPHLGHRRYLSCLKHLSLMVGNSSSGLTEAPSFRMPVVNIGDRQNGRVRARNVIDVRDTKDAILAGMRLALSARFRNSLKGMRNPYERFRDGSASERIKDVLRDFDLSDVLLKKRFYDLA
jgi:UDP-hydrolysing UDP-N-acetyl-D-glucosamine 2-epimerase